MENENKRRHERVKLPYILKFRSGQSKSHQHWDAVTPINMSKSGICFITMEAFQAGATMELLVTNPILKEERVYECKVLRSTQLPLRPMFYETIVTIEKMSDDSKETYFKLLQAFSDGQKSE